MAIKINNIIIKDKDYLQLGAREQLTTNVRKDLLDDFRNLCKAINRPMSASLDCLILMLSEDEQLLQEFVSRVRKY